MTKWHKIPMPKNVIERLDKYLLKHPEFRSRAELARHILIEGLEEKKE